MAKKSARTDANGDATASPVPIDDPSPRPPSEAEGEEPSNQPVHVVRFGPVRACIWRNHDGERAWYQVTVNRLYKGQDDQWHSTDSFGYGHLLPLSKALDSAHSWIAEQLAANEVPF